MDCHALAVSRRHDLQLSVFAQAQTVSTLLGNGAGRRKAARLLRASGITKVYLDVYRGYFTPEETLRSARDYLRGQGFDVAGGITTVAGPGCGKASTRSPWLCWSAAESQEVICRAAALAGRLFDEIIIDDFLCTACRCSECAAARGQRDWGEFYRGQLAELAQRLIIAPAKRANPKVEVIIKYPQWYDRFHSFGYDVLKHPRRFDRVAAGTETRDPEVEWVQPTQGYVNYRWLHSIAGERMGGAWFDRINTCPETYLQQAYQSVLAGARELILFDYRHEFFAPDAPHMVMLLEHFERLCDLARAVAGRQPVGVHACKPRDSDGGEEAWVFDYLAMFGIPVIPCSRFPHSARSAVLTAHAAHDPGLQEGLRRLLDRGATVLLTAGVLERLHERGLLAAFGYGGEPTARDERWSHFFRVGDRQVRASGYVRLRRALRPQHAETLAAAMVGDCAAPMLTRRDDGEAARLALVADTMRYEPDSTRVTTGEPVSLIDLPDAVVNALRAPLLAPLGITLEMPPRVSFHPFAGGPLVFENFGRRPARLRLALAARQWGRVTALTNIFTRGRLRPDASGVFEFTLAPQEVAGLRLIA